MVYYVKQGHQAKEVTGRESKEDASNSKRLQQQQGTAATARSQQQQELQQQQKPAKGGMHATVTAGKSARF